MNTPLISPQALHAQLNSTVVFDTRHQLSDLQWGRTSYAQAHIPGAQFLHMDEDLSGQKTGRNGRHPLPQATDFVTLMQTCGVGRESHVLVYDQNNGTMAARLWWMLKHWLGLPYVQVLDGGWDAWVGAGLQVETTVQPQRQSSLQAEVQVGACVDVDWVLAHHTNAEVQLVDARAPERFAGLVEPMDPIAGHIPHASNRACSLNVQADGTFKPSSQLREEWHALLGERTGRQVIHQCGSGVTACHNLLAMEVAGYAGMRIYPGSWSEWCSDTTRPMA